MRLPRAMQITIAGSVLSFALAAAPALANEGPQGGPPLPPPGYAPAPLMEMAPEVRESWLAECHSRMGRRGSRRHGEDFCARYLDDYYARYRASQPYAYGYQGPAYGYPGYAGGACCQPMMMVPVRRAPRTNPDCKETVEYEYVEVPARASPPRPAPDKRIKVAPDKRVPLK